MLIASNSGDGAAAGIFLLVIFLFGAAFYLIPSIIAVLRKVPNVGSVVVINVLLGWSLIGWVVALAMAARSAPPVPVQQHYYGPPPA